MASMLRFYKVYSVNVETTTQTSKTCEVVVVCSGLCVYLGTNARGKHLNPGIRHHLAPEAAPLRPTVKTRRGVLFSEATTTELPVGAHFQAHSTATQHGTTNHQS
jgi:hypothetical protein